MPRSAIVICVGALLTSILHAQDVPTFRSGTTLVEFTIVATDGSGNPVADLTQEEIVVTDAGVRRSVEFFRFEGAGAPAAPPPLSPGLFTNRVEYSAGPPRNVTALLVDALNTPPLDQTAAREGALAYLRTIPAGTRVAVYGLSMNGLVVLHDFTQDAASLRTGMEEAWKRFPIQSMPDVQEIQCWTGLFLGWSSETASCEQELKNSPDFWRYFAANTLALQMAAERRRTRTLAALEALGSQLAGIPGRKSLVWIGRGFSTISQTGAGGFGSHGSFKSYQEQVRATARRLASQGVAVYPVDSRSMLPGAGPSRPMPDGKSATAASGNPDMRAASPDAIKSAFVTSHDPWPTMDLMASVTGGRVIKMTNDLMQGAKVAAADVRAAYSIGFYGDAPDGEWHELEVRSTRRGVRLTYARGYLADAPASEPVNWTEDQWRGVIANPVGSTAIRIDARAERVSAKASEIAVLLQIAAHDLYFRPIGPQRAAELDIVVAERMPSGDAAFRVGGATFSIGATQTVDVVRYSEKWTIHSPTSTLVLAVRDRLTGRHGTLEIPTAGIPPP